MYTVWLHCLLLPNLNQNPAQMPFYGVPNPRKGTLEGVPLATASCLISLPGIQLTAQLILLLTFILIHISWVLAGSSFLHSPQILVSSPIKLSVEAPSSQDTPVSQGSSPVCAEKHWESDTKYPLTQKSLCCVSYTHDKLGFHSFFPLFL